MAWKNITQRSFADDLVVTHAAVKELDDAHDFDSLAKNRAIT